VTLISFVRVIPVSDDVRVIFIWLFLLVGLLVFYLIHENCHS
jgi:hypothetical protein